MAIQHLRTRDARYDLRSYVAIHLSLVLGAGVLVTGSIWAKASWGHWWVWDEPTLVSFLVVFLLYATYQPLRFSIEDPERQARYASVFAVTAGAFVPLNFLAVRLAQAYTHPRVFATRRRPAGRHAAALLIACVGHGAPVRHTVEVRDGLQARPRATALAAAQARRRRRSPRGRTRRPTALMPALPLDKAGSTSPPPTWSSSR